MAKAKPNTKTCSRCHQERPLEDFWGNTKNRDGRESFCRPCGRLNTQSGRIIGCASGATASSAASTAAASVTTADTSTSARVVKAKRKRKRPLLVLSQQRYELLVMLYRALCHEGGHDIEEGRCSLCGLTDGEEPWEAEVGRPIPILEQAIRDGVEP